MSSSYVNGLIPRIRRILEQADLTTVSAKAVRKQLVAGGEDADTIKENRSLIDEKIGAIYEELTAENEEEEEDESEDERKPRTKSESFDPASSQPEPLSTKQEHTDAAMAAQLQAEYDAAMRRSRGRRAAAPVKKSPKKKALTRKRVDSDSEDDTPKKKRGGGGGAFNKELLLSDALSSFLNETQLSRPQTVKRIWAYIKEHDLQDPSDKRYILCDDNMKSVFHTDKLHMFTMNKLLVPHFRDPDHVVGPKKEER